jgi:signal transduction histidine kinase
LTGPRRRDRATTGIAYGVLVSLLQSNVLAPPRDQLAALSHERRFVRPPRARQLAVLVVVTLFAGYLAERLRMTGRLMRAGNELSRQSGWLLGRSAGLAHDQNPSARPGAAYNCSRLSPALSDEDRQLCEIVHREAARLNDLVSDMTDLARPRAPQIAVVDAAAIAREVVELASKSGRAATDVDVVYEGLDTAPIRADGAQLRQLIWNLVRNAVQASSAGDAVRVSVHGDGGVVLEVADRGIGIDEQARERLFDAFFTTRSQGTGVGLAVVKRIADEHGFEIQVISRAGRAPFFG